MLTFVVKKKYQDILPPPGDEARMYLCPDEVQRVRPWSQKSPVRVGFCLPSSYSLVSFDTFVYITETKIV